MKIAFHSQQCNLGGTEVAKFGYAIASAELLHTENIIIFPRNKIESIEVYQKFESYFPVFTYSTLEELNDILLDNRIEYFYNIKYGFDDGVNTICKDINHAVFDISQPHGHKFAAISKWLANGKVPYVPHMIRLKKQKGNFRKDLGIPENAIVFGRYGSKTFDIDFVKETINTISNEANNIYFLFMNTEEFNSDPEKVFFIEPTESETLKAEFINTCNAMIHARQRGETFGLSCGEFSIMNKPVISYRNSPEIAHIEMLGDKGIYYRNRQELYKILTSFPDWYKKDFDYNAYRDYSPEKVMQKFKEVFL